MRAIASDVSNVKPIDAVSWKRAMSISATPGGAVGCTSTGSAFASIAAQIGANAGSVSGTPPMLASTMTPDAPAACARSSSASARSGYCHGSDANQRRRSGCAVCAAAMSSFMIRAACRLTSGPPQKQFGHVSDTHADVHAAFVHRLHAQAVVEHRRHRRHERRAVEVDRAQAAGDGLHRVPRAAVLLQELKPRLGEAMRVYVDDRTCHVASFPAIGTNARRASGRRARF